MGTLLVSDSGTPVIDAQGNLITITGNTEFKQRITNVFSTQKNSETLFLDYGFDLANMINNDRSIDQSILLRTLAVDALNPLVVLGMKTLYSLSAIVTGTTGNISMTLLTDDGLKITEDLSIYNGA